MTCSETAPYWRAIARLEREHVETGGAEQPREASAHAWIVIDDGYAPAGSSVCIRLAGIHAMIVAEGGWQFYGT